LRLGWAGHRTRSGALLLATSLCVSGVLVVKDTARPRHQSRRVRRPAFRYRTLESRLTHFRPRRRSPSVPHPSPVPRLFPDQLVRIEANRAYSTGSTVKLSSIAVVDVKHLATRRHGILRLSNQNHQAGRRRNTEGSDIFTRSSVGTSWTE